MNKYQAQTDQPVMAPARSSYAERQFLHTFTAGVLLPLGQSAVTGVMIFIVTIVIGTLIFDWVDPLRYASTFGVIALVATYLYLQRRWLSLTALEEMFDVDLNGDQVIGQPEPQVIKIQITEQKDNGHVQIHNIDLPASPQQLEAFAHGVLSGAPLSEKFWTGSGRPFSSPQYRSLMTVMMARGLVEYVNEKDRRQGRQLTRAGRAVMKHYAVPSPTPLEEEPENE